MIPKTVMTTLITATTATPAITAVIATATETKTPTRMPPTTAAKKATAMNTHLTLGSLVGYS